MYKFIEGLSITWERPKAYGWFHLVFLVASILLATLMIIFIKKDKDNKIALWKLKTIIGIFWAVLFVIEILKQLLAIGHNDNTTKTWVYDIYNKTSFFPYVLCSTPLYVIPIYLFIPEGKVSEGILSYLGIYTLWMGGFVMFYPGDVFTTNRFISFHSIIYHSLLFSLGLFLTIRHIVRYHWKNFLAASVIFLILYSFAVIGNEIIYQLRDNEKFSWAKGINLFNMSHRKPNPMVSNIDFLAKLKPWVLTILYIPFTFIGVFTLWSAMSGIGYLVKFIESKYKRNKHPKIIKS